jgi:hypothetical protein
MVGRMPALAASPLLPSSRFPLVVNVRKRLLIMEGSSFDSEILARKLTPESTRRRSQQRVLQHSESEIEILSDITPPRKKFRAVASTVVPNSPEDAVEDGEHSLAEKSLQERDYPRLSILRHEEQQPSSEARSSVDLLAILQRRHEELEHSGVLAARGPQKGKISRSKMWRNNVVVYDSDEDSAESSADSGEDAAGNESRAIRTLKSNWLKTLRRTDPKLLRSTPENQMDVPGEPLQPGEIAYASVSLSEKNSSDLLNIYYYSGSRICVYRGIHAC